MATGVAKYGGFYVGRYETSLSGATESLAGTEGTAQSKQGVIPTAADNNTTLMWYGLYSIQNRTYTGKDNSVESSMIWGSQYDAMINWVKNGKNETDKSKLLNMSLGNNLSGNVTTTGNGIYSDDNINNIRDLGGNLREWTLEAYGASSRVYRGGFYSISLSPSYGNINNSDELHSFNGSRMTLFIK